MYCATSSVSWFDPHTLQYLTPGPVASILVHDVLAHLTLDPLVCLNRCRSASAFVKVSLDIYRENSDPPKVKLESIIGLLFVGAGRGIGRLTTALALGAGAVLWLPLRGFTHMLLWFYPLWFAPLPLKWRWVLSPGCWSYW